MTQPTLDPTSERLLLEAERLFATKGYAAVSVREITSAAETNTAAINYHFGSKKNLYMEVFRQRWLPRAHRTMAKLTPLLDEPNLTKEQIVRAAINAFWTGPLARSSEEFYIHGTLIHREMHNRTEVWDMVIREAIEPFYDLLYRLFHRVEPDTGRGKVILNCMSMFSQLVFFSHARPIAQRVFDGDTPEMSESVLVEHIAEFCMHGMDTPGGAQ